VHEFDELVVVENLLVEQPGLNSEVDGPDFRSGEFNIFLLQISRKKPFAPLVKQSNPIALRGNSRPRIANSGGSSFSKRAKNWE
jgi:hypothetical protein